MESNQESTVGTVIYELCNACAVPIQYCFQCCGSGSVGYVYFWPSHVRIRIRYTEVRIRGSGSVGTKMSRIHNTDCFIVIFPDKDVLVQIRIRHIKVTVQVQVKVWIWIRVWLRIYEKGRNWRTEMPNVTVQTNHRRQVFYFCFYHLNTRVKRHIMTCTVPIFQNVLWMSNFAEISTVPVHSTGIGAFQL